jgi:hypothetical protein
MNFTLSNYLRCNSSLVFIKITSHIHLINICFHKTEISVTERLAVWKEIVSLTTYQSMAAVQIGSFPCVLSSSRLVIRGYETSVGGLCVHDCLNIFFEHRRLVQ